MKGKILLFFAFVLSFVFPNVVNAAETLPTAVDGVVTLTENVTLTEKYVVASDSELKIDLNGFTLTGPSDNYAIENTGKLTIVDNGSTKGKIVCPSSTSSCIRNNGALLEINGVTIESAFVVVKTEPDKNTIIKNSTLTSTYSGTGTGAILNWGNTTVENSTVIANSTSVIYTSSGIDESDGIKKDSIINVKNSTLTGKYVVYSKKCSTGTCATTEETNQAISIENGTLTGSAYFQGTSSQVELSGTVKADKSALLKIVSHAKSGTNIILTSNFSSSSLTVPEGVTLTIPEGITYTISSNQALTVKGNLDVKGTLNGANVYNVTQKAYYPSLSRALSYLTGNASDGTRSNDTLVLLKNLTETNATPYQDKNVTIDLNGFTFNGNITNPLGGNMVIEDNSDAKTGTVNGMVTNNSSLKIKGGKFTNTPITAADATTVLMGGTYMVSDIENATIPENMQLKANGDGTYSLVPKETQTLEDNNNTNSSNEEIPKTVDNINIYLLLVIMSAMGLLGLTLYRKKQIN